MQRSFRLVNHLRSGATEYNSTSLSSSNAREFDQLVQGKSKQSAERNGENESATDFILSNDDFLYQLAPSKLHFAWLVERADDLASSDQAQAFNPFEIGMLYAHDTGLRK